MASRLKRRRKDPPDRAKVYNDETMDYEESYQHSSWERERELADKIIEVMKRNKISDTFKLDKLTRGKGNCFMIGTLQQLKRPEVYEGASPEVKDMADRLDHLLFRKCVRSWIQKNAGHPKIIRMREFYDLLQQVRKAEGKETMTWEEYWNYMLHDGHWADNWFVQATAYYLKVNLWIVDTACNEEHPYFEREGNLEDNESCYQTLYLGLVNECHYQSLLLNEEEGDNNSSRFANSFRDGFSYQVLSY